MKAEEVLDELGSLVDSADNFLAYRANSFMTDKMKVDAYEFGLAEIRDRLKKVYLALGGEDWWDR